VSHQLERIVEFADDALLLADGSVARTGRPEDCVQAYIDSDHPMTAEAATSPFTIEGLSLADDGPVRAGAEVGVTIEARATVWARPIRHRSAYGSGPFPKSRVVFATNSWACGIDLRVGQFHAGRRTSHERRSRLYRIQAVVWRRPEGSEWLRSDSRLIRIEAGQPPGYGPAWLDPRLALRVD
jgi:ABC-type glutathione transport system ATPase component